MKSKFTAKTIYILFIGLFAFFQTVSAAPGDLDTTFSQDGKIVQQFGRGHYDVGRAAALQADGKIVVVGTVADGYLAVCGIVRYNPDGTLDTTFDVDGKAFVQITHRWTCRAVTIQPDGKIVTVGFTGAGNDNNTGDFAVVRLNSDGSLDTTFDGDGKVITRLSDWRDSANAVAIQPDGKIVAAGFRYSAPRRDGWYVSDFAVVRYNADGSLDTTFNGDGKAFAGFFGYEDIANSMVIQPDGKIVAAGKSSFAGDNNFGLVRFNPDGTLDTTFNGSGKISTNISGLYDIATSAAIQPDGKIIAAGKSGDDYFTLARYNPDGTLDTTFDGDGFAVAPVRNGSDEPTVTAIQADGKIVAAGTGWDSQTNRLNFAILRYNSDGALDSTFDGDGIVSTDLSGEGSWANALVLQPDGKIVATGYIYNGLNNDFAVARYNANGTLDTTFDGDGKTTIDLGIAPSAASAVAIQTNGKIVAAGGSTGGITLVRYNENGALDTSFADGGISSSYFLENNIIVNALTLQTDGKIVAAGSSNNGSNNTDFAVVRFNANGTLDTSFGIDGRTITSFTGGNDGANSIAVQADGKIVAAGYSSYKDFAIARYNADGTLDNTFDGDGRVITPVLDTQDMARSVVIQPDGKIIAAGFAGTNFNQDFAVVRYNPNGSLDSSFDNDGIVITPVLASDDAAWSVALQPDGKIVAAGSSNNVSVR